MVIQSQEHRRVRKMSENDSPLRKRRYWPGPLRTAVLLAIAALILLARIAERPRDPAIRNVSVMVLAAVGVGIFWWWLSWRSAYPRPIRRVTGWGGLVLLGVAVAAIRIDGFSGNMVPRFRWAWQPPSDTRLEPVASAGQSAALDATTPWDFPQFLGPHRDGTLPDVHLVNPENPPRLVWTQPIGAGWCAFSAVNGFAVTMEQRGEEELVTCYEVATGRLVWSHALRVRHETLLGGVGPRATPTIARGRVYAMGATGVLRCLDGNTGELLWMHDVPAEFGYQPGEEGRYVSWGRSNSPLVAGDLVVVPAGGPPGKTRTLVAYAWDDGRKVWESGYDQISYSSPIIAELMGKRQIIVVNESTVSGHDPQTGDLLWRFSWPGSSHGDANTSQPHVFEDTVLVSKGYGAGLARFRIVGDRGEKIYHNPGVLKTKLTSFVIHGNYGYGLSDGILECVELASGSRQWKGGRYGHGQILLVGEHLIVIAEDGDLALVDATPQEFHQRWRIEALNGQTWNNLCFYQKYLLVRNAEQAACYQWDVSWEQVPSGAEPAASPLE
ncbi:MAG: oxidoreductase [Pirellulaceae bacterium]|nr:MAG: oxidoreductase [Pirellulaceae bacterium]